MPHFTNDEMSSLWVAELLSTQRPLLIGHRGVCARAPENTLPSFVLALDALVDLVELDYHQTQDGIPVVIHDDTLDRTTDAIALWGGKGHRVADRTSSELAALDSGRWFGAGLVRTRLPLLKDALELIQPRGVALIERKSGDPRTCVEVLRAGGWVNQVIVQSFDWDFLKEVHALEPLQVLGALGPPDLPSGEEISGSEGGLSVKWVDQLAATGARVIVWNRWVTSEAISYAHQRGYRVWIYTVNDPGEAARLRSLGVDGFISDDPVKLRSGLHTDH